VIGDELLKRSKVEVPNLKASHTVADTHPKKGIYQFLPYTRSCTVRHPGIHCSTSTSSPFTSFPSLALLHRRPIVRLSSCSRRCNRSGTSSSTLRLLITSQKCRHPAVAPSSNTCRHDAETTHPDLIFPLCNEFWMLANLACCPLISSSVCGSVFFYTSYITRGTRGSVSARTDSDTRKDVQ